MLQVTEVEYCKMKVHYIADAKVVDEKRSIAIKKIKDAKFPVPGFRPGKASDIAIKVQLKDKINEIVTQDLVAHAYDDILFETKIKPIGYPQINGAQLDGSSFWCDLMLLKKPDFDLAAYKDLEIPKPHQPANKDSLTEEMLQNLRVKHGSTEPYGENDFIQAGDSVTIEYTCTIDGEVNKDLSNEGEMYKLGTSYVTEFDDNILGMKPDDERTFDIKFDERFDASLAGKMGTFKVKLFMGARTMPHALDDDLAVLSGYESYDIMRSNIESSVVGYLAQQEKQASLQQIASKLVSEHNFEVPSWLFLMESQKLAAQKGLNWADMEDEKKKQFNDAAKANVKLSLILDSIRDQEPECIFSDQELVNIIAQNLEANGKKAQETINKMSKDGQLIGILASLRDEAVLQWIFDRTKFVE